LEWINDPSFRATTMLAGYGLNKAVGMVAAYVWGFRFIDWPRMIGFCSSRPPSIAHPSHRQWLADNS
jgi:hypothetical protein